MPRNGSGLKDWFLGIAGFAVIGGMFWKLSPWAFAIFAALALYFVLYVQRTNRRDRIRGYSINYLSPHVVRGPENQMAIEYREGDNWMLFKGMNRGKNNRSLLYVPSPEAWDEKVESWAKGRRAEIVGRLAKDEVVRNCDIVDSENR